MCAARSNVASSYGQSTSQGAPDAPGSLPLFADGDNTNCSTVDNKTMEQAVTSGLETRIQDGEATPPAPVAADRTANISGEGVNAWDDWNLQCDRTAPLIGGHSNEEQHDYSNAIEVVATQSLLAQREVEEASAELATSSFGLQINASIGSYPGHPHSPDIEANPGDMQGEFSSPMDEDEWEPSFGVSNTTFDPLLAYRRHRYDHSLNIQQDDLVGEDNRLADSAMEDAGPEAEITIAPVATTKSLQSFSWIPPSASSAFHAIFPGVSSAQTAAVVNGSTRVIEAPMPGNPYDVDMTISERVRLQHTVPPQDIAWPFAPDGTQPLPSVELELFKELEYFIPRLSPTPVSGIFASQAASLSAFPPISSPASRAGPVPVSPSTCRSIERDEGEITGLNREVDPRPAIVTSVQRKASPLRCV